MWKANLAGLVAGVLLALPPALWLALCYPPLMTTLVPVAACVGAVAGQAVGAIAGVWRRSRRSGPPAP